MPGHQGVAGQRGEAAGPGPGPTLRVGNGAARAPYRRPARRASLALDPETVLLWLPEAGSEPPEVVYGGKRATGGDTAEVTVAATAGAPGGDPVAAAYQRGFDAGLAAAVQRYRALRYAEFGYHR